MLESILKNANDVSAYAFDLLHAFVYRPSAWDKADADKEMAYSEAEKQKVATVEALENQIQELRTSFSDSKFSNRQLTKNLTDADEA